jgi:hypothetical protein
MLFLTKNSNKTIAYKKNILFKKLKLRLNGCKYSYIMLIKVALKFDFTFISSTRNGCCNLKKLSFRQFKKIAVGV